MPGQCRSVRLVAICVSNYIIDLCESSGYGLAMDLLVKQIISDNLDQHYEITYENISVILNGDAALVTYLKNRFDMPIEDGFGVADRFLYHDQITIQVSKMYNC